MKLNYNFVSFLTNKKSEQMISNTMDIEKMKLSINIPKEKKGRVLFIEPHPDDVILSMGGSLIQFVKNSLDVTCLCVFSRCGQQESVRKAENRYVWEKLLGCNLVFGDLVNYSCRNKEEISELYTYRECVSMIQRIMWEVKPDFLIGPMGIGEHIDHILVNEALMSIIKKEPFKIIFYEDFPYANRDKYYYMKAINKVKHKIDITPLYNLITEQVEDKVKLNMVYQSQYQLLWKEALDLFTCYAKAIGYEGIYMKRLLNPFELYERFWIPSLNNDKSNLLFPNGVY